MSPQPTTGQHACALCGVVRTQPSLSWSSAGGETPQQTALRVLLATAELLGLDVHRTPPSRWRGLFTKVMWPKASAFFAVCAGYPAQPAPDVLRLWVELCVPFKVEPAVLLWQPGKHPMIQCFNKVSAAALKIAAGGLDLSTPPLFWPTTHALVEVAMQKRHLPPAAGPAGHPCLAPGGAMHMMTCPATASHWLKHFPAFAGCGAVVVFPDVRSAVPGEFRCAELGELSGVAPAGSHAVQLDCQPAYVVISPLLVAWWMQHMHCAVLFDG